MEKIIKAFLMLDMKDLRIGDFILTKFGDYISVKSQLKSKPGRMRFVARIENCKVIEVDASDDPITECLRGMLE